jgi:lipopolysaccharide transport system ATP-binding protein
MDNETVISVENVSKKYCKSLKKSMYYGAMDIGRNMLGLSSRSESLRKDEFWALNDISFEVKKGETLGIIGPNGSGKTTMLKLLNGIFWPDKGKITVKGRVGALIELGAGFHPMLTGRENVYINAAILGMKKGEVDKQFDSIVEFAGVGDFIDSPVKYYSSGMYVRLGFAIAVHSEPRILLVDEVLAVGDEGFQRNCFSKIGELKKGHVATIFVSHNMHLISAFTDKAILLNHGEGRYFENVGDGIKEYTKLFVKTEDLVVESICSGSQNINFHDVQTNHKFLKPGDSFSVSLKYESTQNFSDVDVDIAIFSNSDSSLYFQATNKAYMKRLDLLQGQHELRISIEEIPINNAIAKIAVAIWSKNREDLLFWWRFPVDFYGIEYSTGKTFLNVLYEFK